MYEEVREVLSVKDDIKQSHKGNEQISYMGEESRRLTEKASGKALPLS